MGQAVAEKVPGDDVYIDQRELGQGKVEDLEHLVVDAGLVRRWVDGGFVCARGRVQVVQELAKDDADEGKRHTSGD